MIAINERKTGTPEKIAPIKGAKHEGASSVCSQPRGYGSYQQII